MCRAAVAAQQITVAALSEPAARYRLAGVPASAAEAPFGDNEQIEYIPGKVAGGSSFHALAGHDPRVGQLFQRGARGGGDTASIRWTVRAVTSGVSGSSSMSSVTAESARGTCRTP